MSVDRKLDAEFGVNRADRDLASGTKGHPLGGGARRLCDTGVNRRELAAERAISVFPIASYVNSSRTLRLRF